jgi:rubrerythrin
VSVTFNADEIFEMAEQIERNGARFYRRAAEEVTEYSGCDMLLRLAEMEEKHQKTFASMRKDLEASEDLSTFDPQGEAASYLRAMADGHVFNSKADPTDLLLGGVTIEAILNKALELEKDSIMFYLGMKEMIPPSLGKERIEQIIKEEMKHVVLLNRELAKQGRPGSREEE